MSVPEWKRSESQIDYHYDAVMVDQSIIQLALRDFGVKDKVRTVDFYTKITKMSKEDAEQFKNILNRNDLNTKVIEEYPDWIIDYFRKELIQTSGRMAYDVEMAVKYDDLGKLNYNEFLKRQEFQDLALGECENIFRQLQRIMSALPIDANKLMSYTGEIIKLQEEIINWRTIRNKEEIKYKNN